jgi:hypothetical protein
MKVRRVVVRDVCECGCGQRVSNGSRFVSSHDPKLQGRLWRDHGLRSVFRRMTSDQRDDLIELALRGWLHAGPANWGPGRVHMSGETIDEFMQRRVEDRTNRGH